MTTNSFLWYNVSMNYDHTVRAIFLERDNRFVARVRLKRRHGEDLNDDDSDEVRVHVKNTGRCKELLIPGATVYLEDHIEKMGSRKYRYDLVAVEKVREDDRGTILINMDSQAPNKVVQEAIGSCEFMKDVVIRPETTYGSSRFDFFVEHDSRRGFIEVKGVTLEENGVARFPDAPTERGIKHINELMHAVSEGYEAYIVFVIQMKGIRCFEPNDDTHPQFGEALRHAKATGVHVLAYDCTVTENSLQIGQPVPVRL